MKCSGSVDGLTRGLHQVWGQCHRPVAAEIFEGIQQVSDFGLVIGLKVDS